MKIAFYCPNKPLSHPNPSGDLIIARGIHRALNKFGHDCREVALFRSRWYWKTPAGNAEALAAVFRALQECLRFRPDIWLTYHSYYKSPDVLGPWISGILHIPYVIFQPMYATKWRKQRETRVGFYLNRLALAKARRLLTNNLSDVASLERIAPRSKIAYLPPGIFPEDFSRDEEAGRSTRKRYDLPLDVPLLITVARFRADVKLQSLVFLFEALSLLNHRFPNFRIMVVGDGPMEDEVRSMAERSVPGKFVLTGRVERRELFRYYSAADLFVFPGIGESLGMVFMEAQACGLPVLALEGSGVSQVVQDGLTGRLVAESTPKAMAAALEVMLEDAHELEAMGKTATQFITRERSLWVHYKQLDLVLQSL